MRIRKLAAAFMVVAIGMVTVAGPAVAAPSTPVPGVSASADLPTGFPDNLKQYVAGTAEWGASAWMTGACAGQGGDIGAYINAVSKVEPRLLYWASTPDQRKAIWAFAKFNDNATLPAAPVEDHEPPAKYLAAGAGPGGEWSLVSYPTLCAQQAAAWATPAANVFGFTWSPGIDVVTLKTLTDEQQKSVLFNNPCSSSNEAPYCAQAYYLNCGQATGAGIDQCTAWNRLTVENLNALRLFASLNDGMFSSIKKFLGGIGSDLWTAGAAVVNAFKAAWNTAAKIAKYVSDPASAIDDLANAIKDGAIGLLSFVLGQMNQASSWDPSKGGFLQRYALAAGIGVVLLAFMFLGAINDAHDRGDRKGLADLLRRLGFAFLLILFAPALYAFLEQGASAGSSSIITHFTGPAGGDALVKLYGISSITSTMVPGGVVVGLILFLLMLLGTLGLFVGLMVQRFGMEMAATLIALTAGVYVHPGWSKRVSKLNFTVIGLIASKPVAFLVVGAAFGIIGDNLSAEQLSSSPASVLGGLTIAAVGLVFAGLAPLALLKWAPVLPIGHSGSGGGGLVMGAVIGAGMDSAVRGMQNSSRSSSGPAKSGSASQDGGKSSSGGESGGGPNLVSALDAKKAGGGGANSPGGGTGAAGGAAAKTGGAAVKAGGSAAGKSAATGAASAGAAAATGGASAVAQIAQAALQKAHHAANNHVPEGLLADEDGGK